MNWKQRIVKKYITENFAAGSVSIEVDGPESLRATDTLGESLVFWLDDATGQVMDEHNSPAAYEKWRKVATAHGITVEIDADTSSIEKKLDTLTEKAHALESTLASVADKIKASSARYAASPFPPADPHRRATPRPDTIPAECVAAEHYGQLDDNGDQYTFGPGFDSGTFVFCPDCGHAVRSGYSELGSRAEADQYARENCPECKEHAQNARLETRKHFVRCLEILVRKAEPTVQRLEHIRPGEDGEAIVIHYSGTETAVPISASSLLCIAKSVFEVLPY